MSTSIPDNVTYVPVWKNWEVTDVESAFAKAKVGEAPLSELFSNFEVHSLTNCVTPTEVIYFASEPDPILFTGLTPGVLYAVNLCDMMAVKMLDPIDVAVNEVNLGANLTSNGDDTKIALNAAFDAAHDLNAKLPEGTRYSYPPLVDLFNRSSEVLEGGRITSFTAPVNIRYVDIKTPVKGWAFVSFK